MISFAIDCVGAADAARVSAELMVGLAGLQIVSCVRLRG